MKQYNKPRIP